MLYSPLLIRVLITLLILVYSDLWKTNGIFFFFLMIVLDSIDCVVTTYFKSKSENYKNILYNIFLNKKCTNNYEYQRNDKIADIIFYILIIGLGNFDIETKRILSVLTLYRMIGVYKFYNNKDTKLWHYPDGVNSTIIVSFLAGSFPKIKENYYLSIIAGLLFKYKFETIHNNMIYN
jgi:hypothetical protein